ncbi:Immunoglobulin E-set,Arrestin C-terminal-like domain [Cinara cedri]|uniref:Immunoglobulin E-set,Arrestin C-terminal-like domain n=1 Tax=Cinara cedri TaxID=506608 RepID=A0A5E4MHI2_9HEMI|nr:Immunoglobulin E-set,Arrestin C-terminal-like domain [Cinara cedri]
MKFFLDETCQVVFPGAVIYGVFCIEDGIDSSCEPVIKASGFTRIWKPGTNSEIEEYSIFFEDKVVLSLDADLTDLSLDDETRGYPNKFKFHLVLPNNLPPSHEVPFGHTRYKLETYYNDQTIFKYFSVNQWVGLLKQNNSVVKHKTFAVPLFNVCQSIDVLLNLDQTHYLPGETVFVAAIITNSSWKDVIFSKIYIIQTTKYWKSYYSVPMKHTRVIAEGTRGHLSRGCSQIWENEPLYIPAVIPTTNTSNNPFNFFEIKYKLKLQIVLKNSKKKIVLKQKLFIGNWNKSKNTNINNSKKYINNVVLNNDLPYEITADECSLIKQENSEFIPKYIMYETSQI